MDPANVTMSFPSAPEYLRLARLATADAASRAGFDFEEIDDIRIAVSELCSALSGSGSGVITLEFSTERAALTVIGHAKTNGPLEVNELSRVIVTAVVDEHDITTETGTTRFRVVKRSRADASDASS